MPNLPQQVNKQGKKILFYYPSNKRTVGFETLFSKLVDRGYEVLLLTTCERGILHEKSEEIGVKVFANSIRKQNSILYYWRQIQYLIHFCKLHQVDVLASHLQHTNLIAVIAQLFISTKVVIFRHHFKFHLLDNSIELQTNTNEQRFDRIINNLAKKIIVPSSGVYNGMKEFEKVNMNKVFILPYFYDFKKYSSPNLNNVTKIKSENSCKLLLIMCARLIPFKRHTIAFEVVQKLIQEGYDLKMLVLDEGPERENLENFIRLNNLEDQIKMLGFRTDFIDYMAASDLLIHPSLTEASNSVVKEMGLMKKAVAVCENVGDFSDYIVHEKNGFILGLKNTAEDIENTILKAYQENEMLSKLGTQLKQDVENRFQVNSHHIDNYIEALFN